MSPLERGDRVSTDVQEGEGVERERAASSGVGERATRSGGEFGGQHGGIVAGGTDAGAIASVLQGPHGTRGAPAVFDVAQVRGGASVAGAQSQHVARSSGEDYKEEDWFHEPSPPHDRPSNPSLHP